MGPKWRGQGGERELPFRAYIREYLPSGEEGFNVQDIDLVILNSYNRRNPMLTFYEFKKGEARTNLAQEMLGLLIDRIMSDFLPYEFGNMMVEYGGFHVVHYPRERNWREWRTFTVNGTRLFRREYDDLLLNELVLRSYDFPLAVRRVDTDELDPSYFR